MTGCCDVPISLYYGDCSFCREITFESLSSRSATKQQCHIIMKIMDQSTPLSWSQHVPHRCNYISTSLGSASVEWKNWTSPRFDFRPVTAVTCNHVPSSATLWIAFPQLRVSKCRTHIHGRAWSPQTSLPTQLKRVVQHGHRCQIFQWVILWT